MGPGLNERRLAVIGAGAAGLAAAWRLSQAFPGRVVLLEKQPYVGGLAATIEAMGRRFDLGSHRIHHSFEPEILKLIRSLCGEDLLSHRRNGLILVDGRFIRYPPNACDILKGLGLGASARFARGLLAARIKRLGRGVSQDNFAAYAVSKVGRPLYESFYRPYALKLWAAPPEEISYEAARRRTRQGFWGELRRLLSRKEESTYLYPAQGIGEIAEALASRILAAGGRIETGVKIERLPTDTQRRIKSVDYHCGGERRSLAVESVIATISPRSLLKLLKDSAGAPLECGLSWRGLRIMFLTTVDALPRDHETYYLPSPDYLIGRISEVDKYSGVLNRDDGRRAFTLEIPCSEDDRIWSMPEEDLRAACIGELTGFGLLKPVLTEAPQSCSVKMPCVYPVHFKEWREPYRRLGAFFDSIPNLYRAGRTALFMHSNLDHSLAMGLKLGDWLSGETAQRPPWPERLRQFSDYYVRE